MTVTPSKPPSPACAFVSVTVAYVTAPLVLFVRAAPRFEMDGTNTVSPTFSSDSNRRSTRRPKTRAFSLSTIAIPDHISGMKTSAVVRSINSVAPVAGVAAGI